MSSKIAFLFPGQGSQQAGMGQELSNAYPEAQDILKRANDALGFDLCALCFSGPDDELTLTINAQPAILAVSAAALAVFRKIFPHVKPTLAAGHSLGEYSALYSAGAMTLEDALKAVRTRGELMQTATPPGTGAMAAIIGLDADKLAELCKKASDGNNSIVEPANMNAPDQIVVSGHAESVEKFCGLAKEHGAKRAIPLKVSAPFHCSLMKETAEKMKDVLESIEINKLDFPVIANFTATPVLEPNDIRKLLIEQVAGPVQWANSMQYIHGEGIRLALEIGPGKALAGLMKRNAKDIETLGVSAPGDIDVLRAKL